MPTLQITNKGSYTEKADHSIKLAHDTNTVGILKNKLAGVSFKIEIDADLNVVVKIEITYPNGQQTVNQMNCKTNQLLASVIDYATMKKYGEGMTKFIISAPNLNQKKEVELEISDGYKGVLFQDDYFQKASDQTIQQFEDRYSTPLCADYVAFLKSRNGMVCNWYKFDSAIDLNKGAYQKEMYKGYSYMVKPIFELISNWQSNLGWLYEVRYLFGLENTNPYCDMMDMLPENLFYHKNLYPFAYPIGVDPGGNTMVQIAQGKNKGKLAMLDHEVASSMIDWAEGIQDDEVFKKPFGKATADEFLNDCFEYGGLTLYETTFEVFLKNFIRENETLREEILKQYRT